MLRTTNKCLLVGREEKLPWYGQEILEIRREIPLVSDTVTASEAAPQTDQS